MVWYGMVRHGKVWYGMVWYELLFGRSMELLKVLLYYCNRTLTKYRCLFYCSAALMSDVTGINFGRMEGLKKRARLCLSLHPYSLYTGIGTGLLTPPRPRIVTKSWAVTDFAGQDHNTSNDSPP